jgi:hypothetical protein
LDRLPESHFRFAKDCNVPEMAAGRSCQRCTPPKSSGLRTQPETELHVHPGLLQIKWVIFVILRAIPVFDGDAIADWDW